MAFSYLRFFGAIINLFLVFVWGGDGPGYEGWVYEI